MNLDELIMQNFTADERDTATSGECGTFALALYRVLKSRGIKSELVLLVEVDDARNTVFLDSEPGQMSWRHCAVLLDEEFYDVDGKVEIEDLEANYPWGNEILGHVFLEERDFVAQTICTHTDISDIYYDEWTERFQDLIPEKMLLAA